MHGSRGKSHNNIPKRNGDQGTIAKRVVRRPPTKVQADGEMDFCRG